MKLCACLLFMHCVLQVNISETQKTLPVDLFTLLGMAIFSKCTLYSQQTYKNKSIYLQYLYGLLILPSLVSLLP